MVPGTSEELERGAASGHSRCAHRLAVGHWLGGYAGKIHHGEDGTSRRVHSG